MLILCYHVLGVSNPPPSIMSISSLSPSTISSRSSVGSRTPSTWGAPPQPARPPGLRQPPSSISGESVPEFRSYQRFDWSEEVEQRFEAEQADVPTVHTTTPAPKASGSVSRGSSGYTVPPRRVQAPEGAVDPDQDYEYDEEDVPKRSTADAMKDVFNSAPMATSVGNNAALHEVEEEEETDYLAWAYPEAVSTTTHDRTPAGGEAGKSTDKPWEGYDAPKWEAPTKVNIKAGEKWTCPQHGPTCNPGICKARARLESDRRKQKEHEEREEAKRIRMEKRKKREEKEKRDGGEGRDVPPHLARYRYRGAASDSGSGSGSSTESEADSSKDKDPGACVINGD